VHLSDLHFRTSDNLLMKRVDAIAAAICGVDPSCERYLMLCSGDVANEGAEKEYNNALAFFIAVNSAIIGRLPKSSVTTTICVPGNHDCVLPKEAVEYRKLLVNAFRQTYPEGSDKTIFSNLVSVQDNFFAFDMGLTKEPWSDRLCASRLLPVGDDFVQVNVFNTAFLSQRTELDGHLCDYAF
jgi:Calcineurin-like phosphoesterase